MKPRALGEAFIRTSCSPAAGLIAYGEASSDSASDAEDGAKTAGDDVTDSEASDEELRHQIALKKLRFEQRKRQEEEESKEGRCPLNRAPNEPRFEAAALSFGNTAMRLFFQKFSFRSPLLFSLFLPSLNPSSWRTRNREMLNNMRIFEFSTTH